MRIYENIIMVVKFTISPILMACWLGFGIFNQNWDCPDEIGIVGQSELHYVHIEYNLGRRSQTIFADLPRVTAASEKDFQLEKEKRFVSRSIRKVL